MNALILALAAALTELVPAPRDIVGMGGSVDAATVAKVSVVREGIAGVPEAVAEQAYRIEVTPAGVRIVAPSETGERYARTTLDQLVRLGGGRVPCCKIEDWPKLKWRGCMLDTARNYLSVGAVKDVIDVMSRYKMNLFHWHFTEDNGWRLASARHPELRAEKAFYDPFGDRGGSKVYTQDEFREVVAYAAARGVTVMPEFDVPGHCLAFRRAFDLACMSDPKVETIVADLIDELAALADAKTMPFIHIGGDEVWKEHEKCAEGAFDRWAQRVCDGGRTVVSWMPGQKLSVSNRIEMAWSRNGLPSEGEHPCFDGRVCYIEEYDPFSLLSFATYTEPCRWSIADSRKLGGLICGWHDSAAGKDGDVTLCNQNVLPSVVMFGNLLWHGGAGHHPDYRGRLPAFGDPLLASAVDLERRVVAQRDKVLTDLRRPFPFLAQTQMRWRLSRPDGTVVARDVPQATVFFHPTLRKFRPFVQETNGTIVAETWVRSPRDQEVGAWIGFTAYDRDHGRARSAPMPKLGEWSVFGAKAELNGEPIAPPQWDRPGATRGKATLINGMSELTDQAFGNMEYHTRPPTSIRLKAGWNHVKLTVPYHAKNPISYNWVATFIPLLGTTEHPREVPGLSYSSDPQR